MTSVHAYIKTHTHDGGPDVPSVKSCTGVPLILLSESGISASYCCIFCSTSNKAVISIAYALL